VRITNRLATAARGGIHNRPMAATNAYMRFLLDFTLEAKAGARPTIVDTISGTRDEGAGR
jgi:hypothetical protein